MLSKLAMTWLMIFFVVSTETFAQNQLDPRPYNPEIDPDVDIFINSWQNSGAYTTHGSLTERDILTRFDGDPLKSQKKGQVLTYVNRLSYATLDAGVTTTATKLEGEQEIFYIMSGEGVIRANRKTTELRKGALAVIPEGLEFTMTNTGDELLTMYLVSEPVPEGYEPKKEVDINCEDEMPLRNEGYITVHWSHNGRGGISGATAGFGRLIFNAMTIGQPHSHVPGWEEVWLCTEGKNLCMLGREIRWQPPGTAYRIPPTGFTPHTNINTTEEPVRFLIWIVRPE